MCCAELVLIWPDLWLAAGPHHGEEGRTCFHHHQHHLQYEALGALGVFVAKKSWRIKIKKKIASTCREVSVNCLGFVFSVYFSFMS